MTPEHAAAVARLLRDVVDEPHPDAPRFLLEHLATWGPDGLDVQALAEQALDVAGGE